MAGSSRRCEPFSDFVTHTKEPSTRPLAPASPRLHRRSAWRVGASESGCDCARSCCGSGCARGGRRCGAGGARASRRSESASSAPGLASACERGLATASSAQASASGSSYGHHHHRRRGDVGCGEVRSGSVGARGRLRTGLGVHRLRTGLGERLRTGLGERLRTGLGSVSAHWARRIRVVGAAALGSAIVGAGGCCGFAARCAARFARDRERERAAHASSPTTTTTTTAARCSAAARACGCRAPGSASARHDLLRLWRGGGSEPSLRGDGLRLRSDGRPRSCGPPLPPEWCPPPPPLCFVDHEKDILDADVGAVGIASAEGAGAEPSCEEEAPAAVVGRHRCCGRGGGGGGGGFCACFALCDPSSPPLSPIRISARCVRLLATRLMRSKQTS